MQTVDKIKNYSAFINSKVAVAQKTGISGDIWDFHHSTKPHQKDIEKWAIDGGCRAIFASFGLGKTHMQLEIAKFITYFESFALKSEAKALIVCPLGVRGEFKTDAKRLGLKITYVKTLEEYLNSKTSICITNYERVRDGDVRPCKNTVMVSLDEASCLRSLGSKTYIEFKKIFEKVQYKYVATATPSPNEYTELLNYAAFLGIMDVSQAKTRFFQRNSEKADELTILPNKEEEFWIWVASWGLFITKPSDLGYSDDGYALPKLNINWVCVPSTGEKITLSSAGQYECFEESASDLKTAMKIKKESINDRGLMACNILAGYPGNFIIWHHLEAERKFIESETDAVTMYGSQKEDIKEKLLHDFSTGKIKRFATKPDIAGQGCNFQYHCNNAIYIGIDYKFNAFIQSLHRIYRFQQDQDCNVWIIYTEAEEHIKNVLLAKWKRHDELLEKMRAIIKKYGLACTVDAMKLSRKVGVEPQTLLSDRFTAVHNDNFYDLVHLPDNRFGAIISSFPFSTQYEYSANYNDFGHNESNEKFFEQMDFLVPEMLRVLQPGRIAAIHVKDRIVFGNYSGYGMPSLYPFSDDTIRCMTKHGFIFMGRITVVTDVVRENAQTYRLGWTENSKDGTKMSVGVPEYILIFRKLPTNCSNAYADVPVQKSKDGYSRAQWQIDAHSFWRSCGNRLLSKEELSALPIEVAMQKMKGESRYNVYDYERHVSIAEELEKKEKLPTSFMVVDPQSTHPDVWTDVVRMRGLNTMQGQRQEQQHLCPLPFDIVDRLINRYTNINDEILDPFAGLFTVPYRAIIHGRRGYGIELNKDYFNTGFRYCRDASYKQNIPTLFDLIETEKVA